MRSSPVRIASAVAEAAVARMAARAARYGAAADDAASKKFFQERVVGDRGSLDGFSKSYSAQDCSVTFTYSRDGSGSCGIVFGRVGAEWCWTAYVGGAESGTGSSPSCEEAWKDLLAEGRIGKLKRMMDERLDSMAEEKGDRGQVGTYKVRRVHDGSFAKGMAFSYCYNPALTRQYDFTPDEGVVDASVRDAVKEAAKRLSLSMDVRAGRSSLGHALRVQLVNASDEKRVGEVLAECGLVKA